MEDEQPQSLPYRRRKSAFRVLDGGPAGATREMPASEEAEQHVIACCLLDGSDTISRALEAGLRPAAFYWPANALLFKRILALWRRSPPVTVEMIAEELKTRRELDQVGGFAYLMQVTGKIPTTAHAGYFIAAVREKWLLRELVVRSTEAVEGAYNFSGGLEEFMARVDLRVRGVTQFVAQQTRQKMPERAAAVEKTTLDLMEGRIVRDLQLTTGLPFIDRVMDPIDVHNGMEEWMVIIGGSRSTGKSTFLRHLTGHNCAQAKRGLIFTLETGVQSWLMRLAGARARVTTRAEALPRLPKDHKERMAAELAVVRGWVGERLWIYEDIFDVDQIVSTAQELHRKLFEQDVARGVPEHRAGLHFVGVDYLQLVELASARKGMQREERIGEICRRLHTGFKRINRTCFCTAQLGRTPVQEKRRPTLADFRESGAIENTGDVVLALHTLPENKAGQVQDERSTEVLQELLILKRRNGRTGYEEIVFKKELALFEDAARRGDARPGAPMPKDGYKREAGK